ncbi:ParB family protein [Azotobacter vinelandii]|uniref:ParB family protein n=1 Tax=Azotobacter vinelandii TaxID=354 RepID=UPI00091DD5F9|nr:ParB family protein [Azotobacter vinelandii]WKN23206.1 ParB family protein [Azotobacter vinelandii]SFY07949.1 integrating conjugative element, PFGI_1 class, ParB family protein [Azotobacter vinelandii]
MAAIPTSNASLKDALLRPGFTPTSPAATRLSDPIADTPLVLTLDDVLPYDANPRTTQNPKYDEIKESIRQRGLDAPPPVTRRPGEEKYRIRNGGNTRLSILKELYQETGDDRYYRFHCLFRPWDAARGEIIVLTGHLAENDLKGDLKFIERAIAVEKARTLYEAEAGKAVSQRELASRLSADGYPVSQSHISKMLDTIQHLLPAIPGLLYSGLGVDRISKILALRKTASACWDKHYQGEGVEFEMLFQDVLSQFEGDAEEFFFDRFQDELVGQMKKPLALGYEDVLLEITQQQRELRRSMPIVDAPSLPAPPAAAPAPDTSLPDDTAPGDAPPQQPPELPEPPARLAQQTGSQVQLPVTPPAGDQMSDEERQARIDGHVVSPANISPRVVETKRKVAAALGETLPDFNSNALIAIPVQAGSLHPISDLWYIEHDIDTPEHLREHIAQLAFEITQSVNAPGEIIPVDGGIGFSYKQPADEVDITETAHHTLTLLQSLSGATAIALKMLGEQPAPAAMDALGEFQFAAGLGQILLGQPTARDQAPDDSGRLSDGALVKLFRIVRLARRLIDLEIQEYATNTSELNG